MMRRSKSFFRLHSTSYGGRATKGCRCPDLLSYPKKSMKYSGQSMLDGITRLMKPNSMLFAGQSSRPGVVADNAGFAVSELCFTGETLFPTKQIFALPGLLRHLQVQPERKAWPNVLTFSLLCLYTPILVKKNTKFNRCCWRFR